MRRSHWRVALVALALLGACHRQEGRGGLTADEERRLDNAAAMLEASTIEKGDENVAANAAMLDETVDENLFDID
jgi:hypothetical protein